MYGEIVKNNSTIRLLKWLGKETEFDIDANNMPDMFRIPKIDLLTRYRDLYSNMQAL